MSSSSCTETPPKTDIEIINTPINQGSNILSRYRDIVREKRSCESKTSSQSSSSLLHNNTPLTIHTNTNATPNSNIKSIQSSSEKTELTSNATPGPKAKVSSSVNKYEMIEPVPLENIMELSSQSSIWAMMCEINLNGTFQDSFDHMMKGGGGYSINSGQEQHLQNVSLQTIPVPHDNKDLISYLGASQFMSEPPSAQKTEAEADSGFDLGGGLANEFDAEISAQTESFSITDEQNISQQLEEIEEEEEDQKDMNNSTNYDNISDEAQNGGYGVDEISASFTTSASFDDSKLSSQFVEISINNSTLISDSSADGNFDNESKCDDSVNKLCSSIDIYSSDFESMSPITPSSRTSKKSQILALKRSAYIQKFAKTAANVYNSRGHSPTSANGGNSSAMTPARLYERNKTLVKEVRFADQTCLELGQKNTMLEKEIQRLRSKLSKAKKENDSMHDAVVQSATHGAASDSKIDILTNKITEHQERHELQLSSATSSIEEYKRQVTFLTEQMEWHKNERASLEEKLTASNDQHKQNITDLMESKDVITKLMERLMVNNTDPKAASFYRDDSLEASMDVLSVKDMYEKQLASYLADDAESRGKVHSTLSNDALLLALDNGMSEIRKLKATIHVLEDEIEQKDIEAKKMHDEEDENWKNRESKMKQEINEQLAQIQDLICYKEEMNSQVIRTDEEIRNFKNKVSQLSTDVNQRDQKIDTLHMKHTDLVHNIKNDFEEKKIQYLEQLREAQVSNEVFMSKLNDRDQCIGNLNRDKEYLQEKEEKSKSIISTLETENKQKSDECTHHARKNESYQRKCNLLKEKIGKLTTKCDEWTVNYRNLSKDLSIAKKAKNDALNQLSEYMSQFKAKSCNANGEYIFCEECKHLRRAISTEGKRNANLRDDLEKKDTEIHKLRRLLKKVNNNEDLKLFSQARKISKSSGRTQKSVEVVKEHKKQAMRTSEIENSIEIDLLHQDVV